MSHLDNKPTDFFFEDLQAEMEKMRRQKAKLEDLLTRIEKEKHEMLLEKKAN